MSRNLSTRNDVLSLTVKRGIAAFIDLFVCALITILPLGFLERLTGAAFFEDIWPFALYTCGGALLFFLRDLIRSSPGKRLVGLRVVSENGAADVSIGRLLLRQITLGLWPAEIYQLIKTGGECRLGDKLAGTKVIDN